MDGIKVSAHERSSAPAAGVQAVSLTGVALRIRLDSALPGRRRPPRIYLHIGAMKTGTTYLQKLMAGNREALAGAGCLVPDRTWGEQTRAARDALGFTPRDPVVRAQMDGSWRRVVEEMLDHQGQAAIFSMEFLSFADAARASRVLDSFPGAEVHVILTVRDAATAVPAQWQTSCRNAGTVPWPRFVGGLRQAVTGDIAPRNRAGRMFQRTQGIVRMLEVWTPLVHPDRVHVVTVPPRGSDARLLWERFAGVLGVPPEVAARDPARSNPSLGHASAEFLRRLNVELEGLTLREYVRAVREPLQPVLGERAQLERPVQLHGKGRVHAARWNSRVREAIGDSGVHLVGELSDLPVEPPGAPAPGSLAEPTTEEVLAAAVAATDRLVDVEARLRSRLASSGHLPADGPPERGRRGPAPPRWGDGEEAVGLAAQEAASLVRACVRLRGLIDAD